MCRTTGIRVIVRVQTLFPATQAGSMGHTERAGDVSAKHGDPQLPRQGRPLADVGSSLDVRHVNVNQEQRISITNSPPLERASRKFKIIN
jgi:hypothetical protein